MDQPASGDVSSMSAEGNDSRVAPCIVLVGASFRTAKMDARARMARRVREIPEPGARVGDGRIFESAVLETCNRLEVYVACSSPDEVARWVVARLGGDGASPESFYLKTGTEVIAHIFRVASGLDSPVLGEEQILQQVKEAGRTARTSGQAKSILSSLFDAACSSGERVRESYTASPANRSVSSFALRHALRELGHRPSRVLLIGSGETAKLAALRLKGSKVYLLSGRRSIRDRFPDAERVPRRRLGEVAKKCDLIIAATRRDGYVLTKRDLPDRRRTVVLDLGFPRNVDPSLKDSRLVRLYDLDSVAEWALASGRRGNASAERTVEEETLAALRKLSGLSPHDRTVVEALSKRLTGKLMSPHSNFVKEVGRAEDQSERLLLLQSIFRERRG